MSYINNLFPFYDRADFVKNVERDIKIENLYCPYVFTDKDNEGTHEEKVQTRSFKAIEVLPCDVILVDENVSIIKEIIYGVYGGIVTFDVTVIDYSLIAQSIDVHGNEAFLKINTGFEKEDVISDIFVNSASNFVPVSKDFLSDIKIESEEPIKENTLGYLLDNSKIDEAVLDMGEFKDDLKRGRKLDTQKYGKVDEVYTMLNAYFASPEGLKRDGREVVPLLIGPTGVFKSATVKELCEKYGYRLVDFRAAFTSRLDYSGLYEMGYVDNEVYSYACPMEELVVCSDGFREYCVRAIDKLEGILRDGYIIKPSSSEGVDSEQIPLTQEQIGKIEKTLDKYREYAKPVVFFCDEITRVKDQSVNGILTEMLNQKRFNNMTMYGCKFVAATNANLKNNNDRHNDLMSQLNDMYDVNSDIDIAFSNRFLPLIVQPDDVADRWFEWARGIKSGEDENSGKTKIHPIILKFFDENGRNLLYNDTPVLDAIEAGLTENEQKAQTFPNYRTWDMLSGYLYRIDENYEAELKINPDAKKVFRMSAVSGLISKWGADAFVPYLIKNGYIDINSISPVSDEYTDFLETSLDAGVPALMIGPSSMGKTTRVKSYIKKQKRLGKPEPILINVDMASKDAVDLMGMPKKVSLLDYVSKDTMASDDMKDIAKSLRDIIKDVTSNSSFGLTDIMTLRAPDKTIKDDLERAKREGREVIFFFDEVNRVKSTTIMSSIFEVVSDQTFAGVSFKDMKDKVKVVAACNMTHSEMDTISSDGINDDNINNDSDAPEYSGAGAIDPALAARFSVYWKKKYDEKDVDSWIDYMENEAKEGNIDRILLDFFKTLPKDRAVKMMASVEKRQLAYATPSTRNMHQLSMDIKAFRGVNGEGNKLFYGKVLCDDSVRGSLGTISDRLKDYQPNIPDILNLMIPVMEDMVENKNVWDAVVRGNSISLAGKDRNPNDLMDTLEDTLKIFKDAVIRPLSTSESEDILMRCNFAQQIMDAVSNYDDHVSDERRGIFEKYLGDRDSAFVRDFTNFFNMNFGTENDTEITIEMLSDTKLDKPFFKRYKAARTSLSDEQYEDSLIDLMKQFLDVHGTGEDVRVYTTFIETLRTTLTTHDGWELILGRIGKELDPLFKKAEEAGDTWILSMLDTTLTNKSDIDNVRLLLSGNSNNSVGSTNRRKSVVL